MSALESLSRLLFPSPSPLWTSTSKQQLGVTEAINDHFPAHLPVLFWQLLNGKHRIYWHTSDSHVHKFNTLPLKDRLIQFFLCILAGHRLKNSHRQRCYQDPQLDYHLNFLRIMNSATDEVDWGKKQLNLLESCNSFCKIALASCCANLVFVFMRTVSMHPQATIFMSGRHMLFTWFRSHQFCRQFDIQQRTGPEGKGITCRLGTTSWNLQELTLISRGALLEQGVQAGSEGVVHFWATYLNMTWAGSLRVLKIFCLFQTY